MKIDSEFVERAARIIVIIVVDRVARVTLVSIRARLNPAPVDRRRDRKGDRVAGVGWAGGRRGEREEIALLARHSRKSYDELALHSRTKNCSRACVQ